MNRCLNILIVYIGLLIINLHGQELDCDIIINISDISQQKNNIILNLKEKISQFLNNENWTNDRFRQEERIKCKIVLTLTSKTLHPYYEANAQIQSVRPVYNTEYETPILNYLDNWGFEYELNTPLNYIPNSYTNELSMLLAFYSNLIIALDYNTFSKNGGDQYYQKVNTIIEQCQVSGDSKWKPISRNTSRYWLGDQLNDTKFNNVLQSIYIYHRLGIDLLEQDFKSTEKNILKCLGLIKETKNVSGLSILIDMFFNTKREEIIHIFSESDVQTKNKVFEVLRIADPSHTSRYKKILN